MRKTAAALAASACLALAATAGAEIRPKSYTFSPFIGGYTFEGDQHVDTSLVFGARLGYDYTKRVGVEALVDFGKTDSRDALPDRSVRLLTGGVEGLYYLMPDSRLVPFLAGGVRWVQIEDKREHANTHDLDKELMAATYGVGAKYALAPELALRGDVRHLVLVDEGWNHLEYTLGLAWAFGGKAAAPPSPPPPPPPPAAPTASISASPASVQQGACSNLTWSTSNASSVVIEPGEGPVAASGTKPVCPSASTTYTVTASGAGGSANASTQVAVATPPPPPPPAPPTAAISVDPGSIQKGQCGTLSWQTANAGSIVIDQGLGPVGPAGTRQVCPSEGTTYTVTATGAGGSATAATRLSVTAPPPPPPPAAPTASISANPASVQQGACSNLTWSTTNASNVVIEPGEGPVAASGTKPVCPSASTTYTVTASGAGGTANASTQVAVTAPPPPAPKEPTKEELTIVLNLEFDTDKANVKPQYDAEVARVAEFMKKYPQVNGVIEGHTDNVGGKAYNDRLSKRRADAVKEQLVKKHGIDGSRLKTAGYGFSKPVADNGTEEGRQKNRRIVANFDKVTIVKP